MWLPPIHDLNIGDHLDYGTPCLSFLWKINWLIKMGSRGSQRYENAEYQKDASFVERYTLL